LTVLSFDGYPFIDKDFDSNLLLAAVLASRCHRFGLVDITPSKELKILLSPAIRDLSSSNEITSIKSKPMVEDDLNLIQSQISYMSEKFQQWRSLFLLPIRFGYISTPGVISCSRPSYPQHIFLAIEAFQNLEELREQLLHEFCHNWLYLLQEVVPLTLVPPNVKFTLPSGTTNRSAEEVLGAAHVAASLIIFYSNSLVHNWAKKRQVAMRRMAELSHYLEKCIQQLEQLNSSELLTPAGSELFLRLGTILLLINDEKGNWQ
jgi:hypothetical protein